MCYNAFKNKNICVVFYLVKNIFFISGKAEAGKDTVAEMMKDYMESLGETVFIFRFGDLLKYILKEYYQWNGIKDLCGRSLLQNTSDKIKDNCGQDFFAKFISQIINSDYEKYNMSSIIISDWRYIREYESIVNDVECKNVITVRVMWEHENSLSDNQKKHSSETMLDNFNFMYYINSNTIEGKRVQQKDIIDKVLSDGG